MEKKATGCHFSSSKDTWERTAPVAKSELSASMWKGLVGSGEMRTGAEVTLCFSLAKALSFFPAPAGVVSGQIEEWAGVFREVFDELSHSVTTV